MAFYGRNELSIRGRCYKTFMNMKIQECIEKCSDEYTYLEIGKNDFFQYMKEQHSDKLDQFTTYNFKPIHYVDDNPDSAFHGKYFRELQDEYYKRDVPSFLIDESGTNNIFQYEIFITHKYVPNERLKHNLNVIQSCPDHVAKVKEWKTTHAIMYNNMLQHAYDSDSGDSNNVCNEINGEISSQCRFGDKFEGIAENIYQKHNWSCEDDDEDDDIVSKID